MKRLISASVFGFLFALFSAPTFAAEVVIPDKALKLSIWITLGNFGPVGILTEQDLLGLTNLEAGYRDIWQLDGLEAALNLTNLDLRGNQLKDVSSLSGLTHLASLNLIDNNQLEDISSLAELTNLTSLTLGFDRVKDFSFLMKLTSLTELTLVNDQLEDISFLASLTNLTYLNLRRNRLKDASFLRELRSLTSLYLSFNQLEDVSFLTRLTNLTELDLGDNQLASVTLPEGLTSLVYLNLTRNQLTTLTLPGQVTNLTSLYLDHNQLTNLTLPVGLTTLTTLSFDGNRVASLTLAKKLAESHLNSLVEQFRWDGGVVTLLLPPPILAGGRLTSVGYFDFSLNGSPGTYQIQGTPDFATWTDLNQVTIPESGSVTLTDPSSKSRTKGFYRVVQLK